MLTTVSADVSPFASCTVGGDGTVAPDTEVEPSVVVDPRDPSRIVAAWQQDRWANGAARGIVVASSADGGRTWTRAALAFSACADPTGSREARVSDPWLSFGPDGIVYATGLAVTQSESVSAVVASTSTDGGRTWTAPATLLSSRGREGFNDKESVTADPTRPGVAYVVWDRTGAGGEGESQGHPTPGQVMLATTTDGGRTWSPARPIASLPGTPVGNEVAVLPDGRVVDTFVLAPADGSKPAVMAIRSADGGTTWSDPVTVDRLANKSVVAPQAPGIRGGGGLPAIAVDPASGAVWAAWTDRAAASAGDTVMIASSPDGGATWSSPDALPRGSDATALTPSIAFAGSTLGVSYTDLRAATSARPFLAARFLSTSTDGGRTWTERRLTATFDYATAPDAGAKFLGDYLGLAAAGNSFVSTIPITTGDATDPTALLVRVDPAAATPGAASATTAP